jgi:molybdenum cofactor cytidylyltransferase
MSAAPRVVTRAVVVLAGGRSARMGGANKLTAALGDRTVIAHTLDAALAADAGEVVVVTGYDAAAVTRALGDRPVRVIHNKEYVAGMGSSIAAGVRALAADVGCAFLCPGDLPRLEARHFDALIPHLAAAAGATICVPSHAGRRGHPVLFAARHFAELARLAGDVGARALLARYAWSVCEVPMPDAAVTHDIDTPEGLERLRAAFAAGVRGLSAPPAR